MFLSDEQLPGQTEFKKLVRQAFKNNRFPQSLILTGNDRIALQVYAQWLAQLILCQSETEKNCGTCSSCQKFKSLTHPDYHLIFPAAATATIDDTKIIFKQLAENPFSSPDIAETADILINSVREITKLLSRSPFESDKRIVVFHEAERLRKEAANAFLKTLEEPPKGTFFILVSVDPSQMLPTILSRCQQLKLQPFQPDELREFLKSLSIEPNKIDAVIRQSNGQLSKALDLSQSELTDYFSEIVKLLVPLLKGNLPQMLETIGIWEKQGRDEVISYLQTFTEVLRSAFLLRENITSEIFPNQDLLKEYSRLDLSKSLLFLDEAITKLYRNVNISLVLMNLCIQMRKQIRS